jgi:hypothetical protein
MKEKNTLDPSSRAHFAHQLIFFHMVLDRPQPNLDETCQALRDAQHLDTPNKETGATLLGIATSLLLDEVVLSLLQYGADINHPTGLFKEENSLAFTIALKRTTTTIPHAPSLFPPSSVAPTVLRSTTDEKEHITRRTRILEYFLQHPKLNLNQREVIPSGLGKTVMDWVKELKITSLTVMDKYKPKTEQKFFLSRLHHRLHYGLNDLSDAFQPFSGIICSSDFNTIIKPYTHTLDYTRVKHNRSLVIMKNLEKPNSSLSADKVHVVQFSENPEKKAVPIHQQAWEYTQKNENSYCYYKSDQQWWACGRFKMSESTIVRISTDFIEPYNKDLLVEDIQGRLLYARCQREVVAMEWHRLFNSRQPQYEMVEKTTVVVNIISKAQDLKEAFSKKNSIYYLTGLAEVLCDILITNDVDPNPGNFLVKDNALIHIGGARCWARLREYASEDRFSISQSITELLEQKSLGENGYYLNFFDKIIGAEVQTKAPIYDWLLSMVEKPLFKQELHVALLKRIFLPDNFLNAFVSYYIPSPSEPISLQDQLSLRLKEARDAALKNPEFKRYLQSAKAQQDIGNLLNNLVYFKIYDYTYLCSPEDKNMVKIRENFIDSLLDTTTPCKLRFTSIPAPQKLKCDIKQASKIHLSPEVACNLLKTSTVAKDKWTQYTEEQRGEILKHLMAFHFEVMLDTIKSIKFFQFYGYMATIANSTFSKIKETRKRWEELSSTGLFGQPTRRTHPTIKSMLKCIEILEEKMSTYYESDREKIRKFVQDYKQELKGLATVRDPAEADELRHLVLTTGIVLLERIRPGLIEVIPKMHIGTVLLAMRNLDKSFYLFTEYLSNKEISLALDFLPPQPSKLGTGVSL